MAPRIALLTGKPSEILDPPRAIRLLEQLGQRRILEFRRHDFAQVESTRDLHTFDALIMRPAWGGELHDKHLVGLAQGRKLFVATLSASESRIKLQELRDRVEVISSRWGNADATAELAVWMAITLRRRLHIRSMEMAHGYWSQSPERVLGSLQGTSWTILGAGPVASRLLARLPGMGISKVNVWHYRTDSARFSEFLSWANFSSIVDGRDPNDLAAFVAGNSPFCRECKTVEIRATKDLEKALRNSDVVSVHVPAAREEPGKPATLGLLTAEVVKNLKPDAIIINLARAELVHANVCQQLYPEFTFAKGGFGSDVLEEHIEDLKSCDGVEGDSQNVWAAFASTMLKVALRATQSRFRPAGPNVPLPNVFLSPHVGGSTPEAQEAVAQEVVGKLMTSLGIRRQFDELQLQQEGFEL